MYAETQYLEGIDAHRIFLREWRPESKTPIGVVHINHGMAEHSGRYEPIAKILTQAGYAVVAQDHRGHGHSIPAGGLVGHFADTNGWSLVIQDVHIVNEWLRKRYPHTPIAILGHSMGSFIVQCYLIKYGKTVDAALLSGSTYTSLPALQPSKLLIRVECFRQGPQGRSGVIDHQTFVHYNQQLEHPNTDADWLSRDSGSVADYNADPLCGFICTNQLWMDLMGGLETLTKLKNIKCIPSNLPMYILSGEKDPISYHPKLHGVIRLAGHLKSGGLKNVTRRLYSEGRHEILNEINREDVMKDLIEWLNQNLAYQSEPMAASA